MVCDLKYMIESPLQIAASGYDDDDVRSVASPAVRGWGGKVEGLGNGTQQGPGVEPRWACGGKAARS